MRMSIGVIPCLLVIAGCANELALQPEDLQPLDEGQAPAYEQGAYEQGAAGSAAVFAEGEDESLVPKAAMYRMFTWSKGLPARRLEPTSTSVCVLSRVSGRFAGSNEWAKVYTSGGYWYLSGDSGTDYALNADAVCYYHDLFQSGSAVISGEVQADATSTIDAGPPWAVAMLEGMRGRFSGGGESVYVDQRPDAPSTLTATRGHTSLVRGYVRTFHKFTGGLSQNQVLRLYKPWFVGPQGYRVDPYEANEFNSSSRQAGGSTTRTLMSPVDDTLCYFTSLSGDFRGGGERAQIVPYANGATTVWALETKSGDGRVYARARCIAFDLPMLLQGNF